MMKRKTPGQPRLLTGTTVLATLTVLATTPVRALAAFPAGTPAAHLEGVTPKAAAAALLGDGNLSRVQLEALDHLGNRNGSYDLGDLLSWVHLCLRGEVDCGSTAPAAPVPPFGVAGLLSGRAFARRRVREIHSLSGSTRSMPRPGADAFGRFSAEPASARAMALWYAAVVLLGAALLWGCADGDDLVRPVSLEPDPGYRTVELTVPEGARDIGAMLVVDGPGIDRIEAPGFEVFQSAAPSSARRQVIVRGELTSGPVLWFHVPDRRDSHHHHRDSPACARVGVSPCRSSRRSVSCPALRAGRGIATFLQSSHVWEVSAPPGCKLHFTECKSDMSFDSLTVALVTDVFPAAEDTPRLDHHLSTAASLGAHLAVLPELPLHPWTPLTRQPSHADAEPPRGPCHRTLAAAARDARLAVLGGTIVRDPDTTRRHNTALLFGPAGEPLLDYRKVHLPDEEGYWEAHHYEPGDRLEPPARLRGWGIGVQICSDANRPQACSALAAMGADVILIPRATPAETWARWRLVLRAAAVTSCAYVISVNRPGNRSGNVIGGPSVAIAPTGDVLLETTDPVAAVTLDRAVLTAARREYPGYLDVRADVYTDAWRRV